MGGKRRLRERALPDRLLANNTNNIAVALDCSITYHTSPDPETLLIVEGENLFTTRQTAAYLFKIHMKENKKLTPVATIKSVSYQTNSPIDQIIK